MKKRITLSPASRLGAVIKGKTDRVRKIYTESPVDGSIQSGYIAEEQTKLEQIQRRVITECEHNLRGARTEAALLITEIERLSQEIENTSMRDSSKNRKRKNLYHKLHRLIEIEREISSQNRAMLNTLAACAATSHRRITVYCASASANEFDNTTTVPKLKAVSAEPYFEFHRDDDQRIKDCISRHSNKKEAD